MQINRKERVLWETCAMTQRTVTRKPNITRKTNQKFPSFTLHFELYNLRASILTRHPPDLARIEFIHPDIVDSS